MFISGINKGSSFVSFAMRFTTITQGNARGIMVFYESYYAPTS
jgi:hypothetical protein